MPDPRQSSKLSAPPSCRSWPPLVIWPWLYHECFRRCGKHRAPVWPPTNQDTDPITPSPPKWTARPRLAAPAGTVLTKGGARGLRHTGTSGPPCGSCSTSTKPSATPGRSKRRDRKKNGGSPMRSERDRHRNRSPRRSSFGRGLGHGGHRDGRAQAALRCAARAIQQRLNADTSDTSARRCRAPAGRQPGTPGAMPRLFASVLGPLNRLSAPTTTASRANLDSVRAITPLGFGKHVRLSTGGHAHGRTGRRHGQLR